MHSFLLDISLSKIAGHESRLMSHFPKRLYVFILSQYCMRSLPASCPLQDWVNSFSTWAIGGCVGDFSLWWPLNLSSILCFYWPWKLLWSVYSRLIHFFYCFFNWFEELSFVSYVNIANIVSYAMNYLFMFKSRSLLWDHKDIVLCYLLEALFIIHI